MLLGDSGKKRTIHISGVPSVQGGRAHPSVSDSQPLPICHWKLFPQRQNHCLEHAVVQPHRNKEMRLNVTAMTLTTIILKEDKPRNANLYKIPNQNLKSGQQLHTLRKEGNNRNVSESFRVLVIFRVLPVCMC